jgi:hypothetical protein
MTAANSHKVHKSLMSNEKVNLRTELLRYWRTLSLGVKQPGHEADHSPPSSSKVKECMELYLHSPICLHGTVLS